MAGACAAGHNIGGDVLVPPNGFSPLGVHREVVAGRVPSTGVNIYSLFVAVIGAVLVLVLYHAVRRQA